MNTVYAVPQEFEDSMPNTWDYLDNRDEYDRLEQEWRAKLKEFCHECGGDGQYIGEIVRFPVADGCAEYMICAIKGQKAELLHIPLSDAYQYPHVAYLPVSELKGNIDGRKRMEAFHNSWKSQTVGDVNAVIEAVCIPSDTPREGYIHVEWLHKKYLLPHYKREHNYDHGIYKYLANMFKVDKS